MASKPLYEELCNNIKSLIGDGKWGVGDKIPGDFELMEKFKVSRETVRRALNILVEEGYLIRRAGKGTFVCRRRKSDFMEQFVSFSSELITRGYVPGAKIIRFEKIKANANIADKLNCEEGTMVYYIERIRYANDLPIALEESYIIADILGEISESDIHQSMYEFLVYKKGINFTRMEQDIRPTMLEPRISEIMNVEIMPVIKVTRVIHTNGDKPFFYLCFTFRGDIYSIKSEFKF